MSNAVNACCNCVYCSALAKHAFVFVVICWSEATFASVTFRVDKKRLSWLGSLKTMLQLNTAKCQTSELKLSWNGVEEAVKCWQHYPVVVLKTFCAQVIDPLCLSSSLWNVHIQPHISDSMSFLITPPIIFSLELYQAAWKVLCKVLKGFLNISMTLS